MPPAPRFADLLLNHIIDRGFCELRFELPPGIWYNRIVPEKSIPEVTVMSAKSKAQAVKNRVFELLCKAEDGDRLSRIVDRTIMSLIALSILSIVLESFTSIYIKYYNPLRTFETVTVIIFTVEYLLRIWTADLLYPESKHPRLKYIFSWMALFDLLAILPFYLPFFAADLRFLRMVRLFRLFRLLRVFKLGRYFDALQVIMKVIRTSGPQLVMSFVICFFVMLFSAMVMYTVEYPVQPAQFPNVISALWWAMCALTTVGYGDVYPVTVVGKVFASVISLVGIGIIAIPTGIIAAGFDHAISGGDGEASPDVSSLPLDTLTEEELVTLQARLSRQLKNYGYSTSLTLPGSPPGPDPEA